MGCERARERAPAHTWEVVRTQTTRETPSLSLSPPPPLLLPRPMAGRGKNQAGEGSFGRRGGRSDSKMAAVPLWWRLSQFISGFPPMYVCVCVCIVCAVAPEGLHQCGGGFPPSRACFCGSVSGLRWLIGG